MAITESNYIERVTIFLNPDGSLKLAQQEKLLSIDRDGVNISNTHMDAEPLDATALVSILPQSAALVAQVSAANDAAEKATKAAADAKTALAQTLTDTAAAIAAIQASL